MSRRALPIPTFHRSGDSGLVLPVGSPRRGGGASQHTAPLRLDYQYVGRLERKLLFDLTRYRLAGLGMYEGMARGDDEPVAYPLGPRDLHLPASPHHDRVLRL